jgi:hypothetical protein
VEIHQANRTSSDISFDLELTGDGVPNQPPANKPPFVSAGANQTITLPASVTLNGTVTDDGLPTPPKVTVSWSQVSGPGTVTFATPNLPSTRASFSVAGTYVLRLTASDGAAQTSSDVTVGVLENRAPVVNAGTAQTITLPATAQLNGTATDDGLPNPPGALSVSWSKVSGPGTVTFLNANAVSSSATFSTAGTYDLRLTATDGALQTTSDVTIIVLDIQPPQAPRIDDISFASGQTPTIRITFTANAGTSYTVQYTDSLSGGWAKLSDVPAQGTTQNVTVGDTSVAQATRRYYRIVTPQQ